MPGSSEENSVIEHYARFEGVKELLEEDIAEDEPTQAEYSNVSSNHPAFKELYLQVRVVQQKYKSKYVPNTVTEEAFNDATQSPYKYNDLWLDKVKKDFKKVNKDVVNFMESRDANVSNKKEEKFCALAIEEVTKLAGRITLESTQVTRSIDDTYKKLHGLTAINPNQSQVYSNLQQQLISVIDDRIPALITALSATEGVAQSVIETTNQEFSAFENNEKTRLYQLVQLIAEKTSYSQPSFSSRGAAPRSESIHLKKAEPPKFSGEEVEFPEFLRKWLAVVGPANLPEEAEVDRLRDSIPEDAKEMLTGVSKVSKAWDILSKRYGDKDLIATKLKNELKGLTFKEKADHERVIAIAIKIRSLVTRLESLQASDALRYDGEFISAVYFQLPDRQKTKWLEFDKALHTDK